MKDKAQHYYAVYSPAGRMIVARPGRRLAEIDKNSAFIEDWERHAKVGDVAPDPEKLGWYARKAGWKIELVEVHRWRPRAP